MIRRPQRYWKFGRSDLSAAGPGSMTHKRLQHT